MRLFIPAGMALAVLLIVQAKGCGVCFVQWLLKL
jgi:hypothetical protein